MKQFEKLRESLWNPKPDNFKKSEEDLAAKLPKKKLKLGLGDLEDAFALEFRNKHFDKDLVVADVEPDDYTDGVSVTYRKTAGGKMAVPVGREFYTPKKLCSFVRMHWAKMLPPNVVAASIESMKGGMYTFVFMYRK